MHPEMIKDQTLNPKENTSGGQGFSANGLPARMGAFRDGMNTNPGNPGRDQKSRSFLVAPSRPKISKILGSLEDPQEAI